MIDSSFALDERKRWLGEMIYAADNDRVQARNVANHLQTLRIDVSGVLLGISTLSVKDKKFKLAIESLAKSLEFDVMPANIEETLNVLDISYGCTILEKIGAICNVWAAITATLQGTHHRLKIQQSSPVVLLVVFNRRAELLSTQLVSLREALHKYQTVVTAQPV